MIDEKDLTLAEQAEIGILMQEPQDDDEEPVALTKVFHSKAFITQAAAMKIELDLPEGLEDELQGGSDTKENSDGEIEKVKKVVKVCHRGKREAYVEVDTEEETEEEIEESKKSSKPRAEGPSKRRTEGPSKRPSKRPLKHKLKADEAPDVEVEKESRPKRKKQKRNT